MKLKQVKTINEWIDDEDELSPAERALIAKAEKDLEKKGVKIKTFDPDKIVGKEKTNDDDEEDESNKKSSVKPAVKPAVKQSIAQQPIAKQPTVRPTEEPTTHGARGDKVSAARKFMQDNPNASRKQFAEFLSKYGVSPAYANTMFYAMKKKLREVFYITNDNEQVLAENDIWTSFDDYTKRLLIFKNEWNAHNKALKVEGKVKKTSV